ncbi:MULTISPECIES: hypothetical protein [unclassified Micromonospora]|uniref:hypothetical protein n=1 Tax=unclassified Micromonospora TaxID=2617518 RepID=UPI0033216672
MTTTIPTWHHPHFVSATDDYFGTRYQFKPFTGDEPEPALDLPEDVAAAFRVAYGRALAEHAADPVERNRAAASAISAAWSAAEREARAANTSWRVARFTRDVTAKLRNIAPAVHAYQAARKTAVDTYDSLHGTPDGFWQAKLLTLAELREKTLAAARQLDREASGIAVMTEGLPERVLEGIPAIGQLAKECGAELGGWTPDSSDAYEWSRGPTVQELERLFTEQDARIAAVTRMFGGSR